MLDIEAQHRLAWHGSHFNRDQPRVPAGHPDGGQWTKGGWGIGVQFAAADKPGAGGGFAIALHLAMLLIEAFRSKNGLRDLFGHRVGTVAVTTIDGKDIFGSNSKSPTYTSADHAAAVRMRNILSQKYPEMINADNAGQMPSNALFHAEATSLLRAARANGGSLAGRTIEIFVDDEICNNCKLILPKVAAELGNPTVTVTDNVGQKLTMRDGELLP
jgi:hypothetical protein